MGEIDRLSNTGLDPALPIADRKRNPGGSTGKRPDPHGRPPESGAEDRSDPGAPRPPKSIIDEYA